MAPLVATATHPSKVTHTANKQPTKTMTRERSREHSSINRVVTLNTNLPLLHKSDMTRTIRSTLATFSIIVFKKPMFQMRDQQPSTVTSSSHTQRAGLALLVSLLGLLLHTTDRRLLRQKHGGRDKLLRICEDMLLEKLSLSKVRFSPLTIPFRPLSKMLSYQSIRARISRVELKNSLT